MLIPALRTIGNIVTGDDAQTQVYLFFQSFLSAYMFHSFYNINGKNGTSLAYQLNVSYMIIIFDSQKLLSTRQINSLENIVCTSGKRGRSFLSKICLPSTVHVFT